MSAGSRRNNPGYVELYQTSLDRRLQQGQWDLVCRDEVLCKEVEGQLSKSNAQEIHSQLGLDTLSVIEASLRASPNRSGSARLRNLTKAFQVLELAALNLYLCPWRKEYRVVKMFSGMFTHCIKPALTSQQVQELFGLLGYQTWGTGAEEELRLGSKPTDDLLCLACAFFIARLECQLLLSIPSSFDGDGVEWELQLVQERRCGLSLHAARDSARRKLESTPPRQAPNSSLSDIDSAVDLYTDDNVPEGHHISSPPTSSYIPASESWGGQGSTEKESKVSVSSMHCGITPKNNSKPSSYSYRCMQCGESHDPSSLSCEKQAKYVDVDSREQETTYEPKDGLKQHTCMLLPTEEYFIICHDCQCIHDVTCTDVWKCTNHSHNVQSTGKLQPSQAAAPPQRHSCLETDSLAFLICNTCNLSHDLLCKNYESCQAVCHEIEYINTTSMGQEENRTLPTSDLHSCCLSTLPEFVCYTCRMFHSSSCNGNRCQSESHDVHVLKSKCSACSKTVDLIKICVYCLDLYCKKCWFENPLNCKCGKPFQCATSV